MTGLRKNGPCVEARKHGAHVPYHQTTVRGDLMQARKRREMMDVADTRLLEMRVVENPRKKLRGKFSFVRWGVRGRGEMRF